MNEVNKDDYDDYIDIIESKLDTINDDELKYLIIKLINERNFLTETLDIDPLTGVYNRRVLDRVRDFTTVAMCDVDYFKNVNDSFGHQKGDSILKQISQILVRHSRVNDFVCRYGGDEFLIIFCGANEMVVKNRMEAVLREINTINLSDEYTASASIGIASKIDEENLSDIIKKADEALYESKNSGRNAVRCYSELQLENNEKAI